MLRYFLLFCTASLLVAHELPESSIARYALRSLLTVPYTELSQRNGQIIEQGIGIPRVRFSIEQQDSYVYLLFVPEHDGHFQIATRGSYIIRRSLRNNTVDQLKIFLSQDSGHFLRLLPTNYGTRMNIYIDNQLQYQNIQLPVPFPLLLVDSFHLIQNTTERLISWNEIFFRSPEEGERSPHRNVENIAELIKDYLPHLPDAEDGAMDANGNLVFIDNLRMQNGLLGFNCSGFAKWVADGFYHPAHGKYLTINELKRRHTDLRGSEWGVFYEYDRDPYFGLDWTRNIAVSLHGSKKDPESYDLRDSTVLDYIEDVGYPVSALRKILYERVQKYPGEIYFASINQPFQKGQERLLRQHIHVVVLLPYIDENGAFQVRVFERNVETSLDSLHRRYAQDYVHLVHAPATTFQPPQF